MLFHFAKKMLYLVNNVSHRRKTRNDLSTAPGTGSTETQLHLKLISKLINFRKNETSKGVQIYFHQKSDIIT